MPEFENKENLLGLLLLVIPIAFYIYITLWKKNIFIQLGNTILIRELTQSYSAKRFTIKFYFILVALALIVISSANPKLIKNTTAQKKGTDIMLILDVSNSMLANDIKPSRLERAKSLIDSIVKINDNKRIGLITFAGKSFLQVPVTTDYSIINMYLREVSTDAAPVQGTNIPEVLLLGDKSLNLHEKKRKFVILISDGESHEPNIKAVADTLLKHEIIVHTIGIGTEVGGPITEESLVKFKKDENGNLIITKLNDSILKQIAEITRGKYFFINSPNLLQNLKSELTNEQEAMYETERTLNYQSFYWLFLLFGIILLILELFISEKRKDSLA
jgi:Ca-activated chloride channel family protein